MSDAVQVRVRLPLETSKRLLAFPPAERVTVIERGLGDGIASGETRPVLSRCEAEALDTAIEMFRRGAASGGVVGFKGEQPYLHAYGDFAEDLAALRAKFGGVL